VFPLSLLLFHLGYTYVFTRQTVLRMPVYSLVCSTCSRRLDYSGLDHGLLRLSDNVAILTEHCRWQQ
jgi:predicted nucleic acid-binding Zn ribbon protein